MPLPTGMTIATVDDDVAITFQCNDGKAPVYFSIATVFLVVATVFWLAASATETRPIWAMVLPLFIIGGFALWSGIHHATQGVVLRINAEQVILTTRAALWRLNHRYRVDHITHVYCTESAPGTQPDDSRIDTVCLVLRDNHVTQLITGLASPEQAHFIVRTVRERLRLANG